jgi:hypothetical protein
MAIYYAARPFAARAASFEIGDPVDTTLLTDDELRGFAAAGVVVRARFVATAAALAAADSVVGPGGVCLETDTGVVKVGDGVTRYSLLPAALSGTYAPMVSPAFTGTPTVNGVALGGGSALFPARPSGVDQSFRLKAVGTGATAVALQPITNNTQGLWGYRFTCGTASTSAYMISGPLGHFDITLSPNIVAQSGNTQILGVVPSWGTTPATPQAPMAIQIEFNYGSSQTWAVKATNTAGSIVTIGSFSQTGNAVTTIRVRRDAVGYLVVFTKADGTSTTYRPRCAADISTTYDGPCRLILGKMDNAVGTVTLEFIIQSLTMQPLDSLTPSPAVEVPIMGPLRGGNELHDALLNTEINRLNARCRAATGIFPNTWWIAPATAYQNFGIFIFDAYWLLPFFRDIGALDQARGLLLNVLANPQAGGRLPAILTAAGPTDPGGGRVWSQALFCQSAAILSHDGDTSWFTYATLANHLAWWEANRKTGRGLFVMDNGQELGWDGAIATNPSGTTNVEPNRFESVIANCLMFAEYRAMQGIAAQQANTTDVAIYAGKAATLKTAIQTHLWSDSGGWLFNYDTQLAAPSPHYQADAIYGLYCGVLAQAQAQVVRNRLMDPSHFLSNYGIATLDKTDAAYLPSGYTTPTAWQTNWNGPIWEPSQYMAAIGLLRYGFGTDALEVARRGANLYPANAANAAASAMIGEWNHPDTGAADAQTHVPWWGWNLVGLRAWLDVASNYDPFAVTTAGTVRDIQPYTRPIA